MNKEEKSECVFLSFSEKFSTALEECYDIDWPRKEKYTCKNEISGIPQRFLNSLISQKWQTCGVPHLKSVKSIFFKKNTAHLVFSSLINPHVIHLQH